MNLGAEVWLLQGRVAELEKKLESLPALVRQLVDANLLVSDPAGLEKRGPGRPPKDKAA